MFATMHNPKKRGKKFSWDDFPTMMQNHCSLMVTNTISIQQQDEEDARQYAAKKGRTIAHELVELMTETDQKIANKENQLNLSL